MTQTPLALPKFAAQHVSRLPCRYCYKLLLPTNVVAAGIRRGPKVTAFGMTIYCPRCGKHTATWMRWKPLDPTHWASQVAAATPAPPVRREPDLKPVETPVADDTYGADAQTEERAEYHAYPVLVLDYTPGNYDHADGTPASVLMIARGDGAIEPLAFSMADTRKLVARALVTLATYDDPLARSLLDDFFATDSDGSFVWPEDPPPEAA